jgi:hypothetical protein
MVANAKSERETSKRNGGRFFLDVGMNGFILADEKGKVREYSAVS